MGSTALWSARSSSTSSGCSPRARRAPGRGAPRGVRGAGGFLRRALDEKHVLVRPVDRGAGAAPAGRARTPRVSALWADTPPRGRVLAALLLAAFLAAPLIADRYLISVLILVLYFAYVGQAWNLLMGFAGQLSLGHALYLGIGAYVAAALWIHFGVGPWLGVLAPIPLPPPRRPLTASLPSPVLPPAPLFPPLPTP